MDKLQKSLKSAGTMSIIFSIIAIANFLWGMLIDIRNETSIFTGELGTMTIFVAVIFFALYVSFFVFGIMFLNLSQLSKEEIQSKKTFLIVTFIIYIIGIILFFNMPLLFLAFLIAVAINLIIVFKNLK